jgi:hypothetical protein
MSKKTTKIRTNKKKRRRVFLLGAGVSTSHGIAAAKDILRHSISGLTQTDSNSAKLVHSLLTYLYPSFRPEMLNYPNIEDFLNLLEMAKTFNSADFIQSSLWPTSRLDDVRTATLKAVTDYIWNAMQLGQNTRAIRDFVACCIKPGDVIITFNWDLTIERALEDEDLWFWYESGSDVTLLKPHGSVDWFDLKALPPAKEKKTVRKLDGKIGVYTRFNFAEYQELRDLLPVIVPPVASKNFDRSFLKTTWRAVYRALSGAAELYVMGYSLPKEDQFARLVLGRAIRNNLMRANMKMKNHLILRIVNPDDAVALTYSRLVGEGAKTVFYQTSFESFVSGLRDKLFEIV